jgi:Ca-activated chloride channel family protein
VSEGRAVGRPEPLRLATNTADGARGLAGRELLTVTVQYRLPDEAGGRWLEFPLTDTGAMFEAASADFRFAAAVAQFGMILQASEYRGAATLGDVLAWAAAALPDPADDLGGYRFDFLDLVRRAQGLAE